MRRLSENSVGSLRTRRGGRALPRLCASTAPPLARWARRSHVSDQNVSDGSSYPDLPLASRRSTYPHELTFRISALHRSSSPHTRRTR